MGDRQFASVAGPCAITLVRLLEVELNRCKGLDWRDATREGIELLLSVSKTRACALASDLIRKGYVYEVSFSLQFPREVKVLRLTPSGIAMATRIRNEALGVTVAQNGGTVLVWKLLRVVPKPKSLSLLLRHVHNGRFCEDDYAAQALLERARISSRPKLSNHYMGEPEKSQLSAHSENPDDSREGGQTSDNS